MWQGYTKTKMTPPLFFKNLQFSDFSIDDLISMSSLHRAHVVWIKVLSEDLRASSFVLLSWITVFSKEALHFPSPGRGAHCLSRGQGEDRGKNPKNCHVPSSMGLGQVSCEVRALNSICGCLPFYRRSDSSGHLASFALLLPTSTEVRVYNLLQLSLGFSFFEHQP